MFTSSDRVNGRISVSRMISTLAIKLTPAWKDSIVAFLAGRLLYSLIGVIVWWSNYRPPYSDTYYFGVTPVLRGVEGALFGVWQRWDGVRYQSIAINGYTDDITSLFFPLYPYLGRWFANLTGGDILISLQLISNVAFLMSLVLLHKIVSRFFSEKIARFVLITLVFFPSGYYFYAVFPQSLILMFILLTYILILRGWWAGALVTGYLSGLTHSTSVVLSILVGVEALHFLMPKLITAIREKHFAIEWNFLFALFAPFTNLLGTFTFLYWRDVYGFPPYAELQLSKYHRAITMPWDGIAEIVSFIAHIPTNINPIVASINIVAFILVLVLTVWSCRRIPWSWWIMQTGFLIFLSTSLTVGNPLIGFFRYILSMFPIFVSLVLICKEPKQRLALFAIELFLAIIYSAMFFMWQYDLS